MARFPSGINSGVSTQLGGRPVEPEKKAVAPQVSVKEFTAKALGGPIGSRIGGIKGAPERPTRIFLRKISPRPRVIVADPIEGQFPPRAEVLRERVLHVHLATDDDPQAGLTRALRAIGADGYVQLAWTRMSHGVLQAEMLRVCESLRPTVVFMQLQTPDVVDPPTVEALRAVADKSCVVVTWCGDVANKNAPNQVAWQAPLGQVVDLTLHSSMTHVRSLRAGGVAAGYLQIGYDEEQYRPAASAKLYDVAFLGNRYYRRDEYDGALRDDVVDVVRATFGNRFGAFGGGQPGGPVALSRAHEVYQRAKIGLNVSLSNKFDCYSSDRIFRILGCGALLLTKSFPGMSTFGLVDGVNCLAWETPQEACEKARRALANASALETMAQAGEALARSRHTWSARMAELAAHLHAVRMSRVSREMILITNTYVEKNETRMLEYVDTLERNLRSNLFREVHLFVEDDKFESACTGDNRSSIRRLVEVLKDPRIRLWRAGRRVTFEEAFRYAGNVCRDSVVCLANADIWFDESLKRLTEVDLTKKFIALSRWEGTVLPDAEDSNDAWIFRPPINLPGNFTLGVLGCDNRIAWEAHVAGYDVINPAHTVHAHHNHASRVRNYTTVTRLSAEGRFFATSPTVLAVL